MGRKLKKAGFYVVMTLLGLGIFGLLVVGMAFAIGVIH